MFKYFVFILCGLLSAASLSARQNREIIVRDQTSGEALFLVYVNTYSETGQLILSVQTDERGRVTLPWDPQVRELELVAPGYLSQRIPLSRLGSGSPLELSMERKYAHLNEVVITGLNTPERMKDALSSYKVITRAQIQAQGAIQLDEVLRNQLNMRISDDAVLGSSVGMQGLTGSKVKILIDGIPVNGREGGGINLGQLNLSQVESIELIQGPMSIVYGTDALGGVINLITRRHRKPWGITVGSQMESIGRWNMDLGAEYRWKDRHQFFLGAGRNFFQGWRPIEQELEYNGEKWISRRNLFFNPIEQYLGNFGYTYRAEGGFEVDFKSDNLSEKIVDRGHMAGWDPFGAYAFDEHFHTRRSMNRLGLKGKWGEKGRWQSQNGYMVYHRQRNRYYKDLVSLEEELTRGKGDQDTSVFADLFFRSSYMNRLGRLSYTLGYDINLQQARSGKLEGGSRQIQDYALYTQLDYRWWDEKLHAQFGLRGSKNSDYEPPLIPSLALLAKPMERMQWRASYAQGYRAPSLKELYLSFIDANHFVIGNPDLKAEQSHHIQVSGSYQVFERQRDYLQFKLTGYLNDLRNGIVLVKVHPHLPNDLDHQYANLSRQRNRIITAEADGQWGPWHYLGGISYHHTLGEPGHYASFSAMEFNANLNYQWRWTGMHFNLFYKYTGPQPFLQPSMDGTAVYNGRQQGYHLLDASVERRFLHRRLHLILGVKNLFHVENLRTTGVKPGSGGVHGSTITSAGFLPRRFFASLRLQLD